MRRQPVQMSTIAAAYASPLHSASCAVDKIINRRAYALEYVRIRPYAEQRVGPWWPWSAFVIGWNACAGLRWPWKFNMFELWLPQSAFASICAGHNRRQKYSRCMRAYRRAWSINPALDSQLWGAGEDGWVLPRCSGYVKVLGILPTSTNSKCLHGESLCVLILPAPWP